MLIKSAAGTAVPLVRKLGIKPHTQLALLSAPAGFEATLGPLPDGVSVRSRLGGRIDAIVCFVTHQTELERRLERLIATLRPGGGLWIAWPKRGSGVLSDLDENLLREIVLPTGLVDNKVCAIDATWSGLRFVWRVAAPAPA